MLYCSRHRVAVCRSNCRPCAPVSKPRASRARGMCNERLSAPIARPVSSSSAIASRTATAEEATKQDFTWKGSDSFSKLDDRRDQTPLPLPKITEAKRVVLVRHGQSTWNAEGRIQGSTDFAELTQKGRSQADTTRGTVADDNFDMLIHSPLARAAQTAEIVWGDRTGPIHVLPSLREIDLYSFQLLPSYTTASAELYNSHTTLQGLLKHDGKEQYGEQFKMWQKQPAEFELDGRLPVRELWFRASLAWQQILGDQTGNRNTLVVAHNAVNQALVATAIGLPPIFFRRLLQNNAATTVLDFQPSKDGPPRVNLDRLNQTPGPPFIPDEAGKGVKARIIFVQHGATLSSEDNLLMGARDEEPSTLGEMQANKAAELLMDLQVHTVLSSPLKRAMRTAQVISRVQALSGYKEPKVQVLDELTNRGMGEWEGRHALEAIQMKGEGPPNVVVVGHSIMTAAMLGHCLGLGEESMSLFKADCGGVSVVEFPREVTPEGGVVQCINYTAHLGRWSVPITNDDMDSVCGIEGCF